MIDTLKFIQAIDQRAIESVVSFGVLLLAWSMVRPTTVRDFDERPLPFKPLARWLYSLTCLLVYGALASVYNWFRAILVMYRESLPDWAQAASDQPAMLAVISLGALLQFKRVILMEKAFLVWAHGVRNLNIFISYRRTDAAAIAGRIYDRLCGSFPSAGIFLDVEKISIGSDFASHINKHLAESDVALVVIGLNWLGDSSAVYANRLHVPDDFVRIELEVAIKMNVPLIPILVDGARMPRVEELPEHLKILTQRQALEIDHKRFRQDIQLLIDVLKTRPQ